MTYGSFTIIIALLITTWGPMGAIASLLLALVGISVAELYLKQLNSKVAMPS